MKLIYNEGANLFTLDMEGAIMVTPDGSGIVTIDPSVDCDCLPTLILKNYQMFSKEEALRSRMLFTSTFKTAIKGL